MVLPSVHNLIPIPIYWLKENVRGFNQSVVVSGNIAEKMRLNIYPDLLIKCIQTPPQAGLSGEERRKNLKNSFVLNTKYEHLSSNYFLFDDVFTTGSTMFEAAKVLKRAGVQKVWGLTIAR